MWLVWSVERRAVCSRVGEDLKTADHGRTWILRKSLARISGREHWRASKRGRSYSALFREIPTGYGDFERVKVTSDRESIDRWEKVSWSRSKGLRKRLMGRLYLEDDISHSVFRVLNHSTDRVPWSESS